MPFTTLTLEQFSQHAAQTKFNSFQQSLEMAELYQKRGYDTAFVGWLDQDGVQISALVYSQSMLGGKRMVLNLGPLVTNRQALPDFYRSLKAYAKKQGVLELVVKPDDTYQTFDKQGKALDTEQQALVQELIDLGYQHQGLQTGYPDGDPQWHYLKDLTDLSPETLVSTFNTNGKRLLKRAQQVPITIRTLKREELGHFRAILESTAQRQGYEAKDLTYYQQFFDSFGDRCAFVTAFINFSAYYEDLSNHLEEVVFQLVKERQATKVDALLKQQDRLVKTLKQVKIWADRYGDEEQALATVLLVYDKDETTYLFGGFYDDFQALNAPILLQEYAMLESLKRGISRYNFLGITGLFDGTDGVLRFKQNFNGYIVRKMGSFHYYPRPLTYRFLQFVKKLLGR